MWLLKKLPFIQDQLDGAQGSAAGVPRCGRHAQSRFGKALRRAATFYHGRQLPVGELQVQQRQALSKLPSADREVGWVQQDDLLQVSGDGFEC